ncbi:MAG: cytochrome c [Chloroflexi bacterium]|nr:cytochrome c [Chloroflexota bacterium]
MREQGRRATGNIRKRAPLFHSGAAWAGAVSAVLLLILGVALLGSTKNEASGATLQVSLQDEAPSQADTAQAIFEQKCLGCHTIGGGRLVGPDLAGVTSRRDRDWLISFISSPDQLITRGDALANQLVREYGLAMPDLGLSEPEAAEVLAYIEAQSASQASPSQRETAGTQLTLLAAADAARGRDIFTGRVPLKNGGAACISCHNVGGLATLGGGAVAKELTESYSNLGEMGVTAVLRTVPFPLMKAIYGPRPLEDDEVANLVTFLREATEAQPPTTGQSPVVFVAIGIAGLLLIVILLQAIWRGRLAGVRQSLVKGGSR